MTEDDNYDVVIDVLQRHHDKLWEITKSNMQNEFMGLGIMDDIRLDQMDELKAAIEMWKSRTK